MATLILVNTSLRGGFDLIVNLFGSSSLPSEIGHLNFKVQDADKSNGCVLLPQLEPKVDDDWLPYVNMLGLKCAAGQKSRPELTSKGCLIASGIFAF
jgi:hypothetical protein